jgi:hypothetical protein
MCYNDEHICKTQGALSLHPTCFFERILSVPAEELAFELRGIAEVPWASFLLNPRRLRGSDFLMRWSQGVWSEKRLIQAVNETKRFFALPYGPSSVAPDDIRAFELYFEKLEQAGLGKTKRPDLLIFRHQDEEKVFRLIQALGGIEELPFTPEENADMQALIATAVLAIECENSLWVAKDMPDYGAKLKPMRRLGGKPGLRKGAVLPTVIVKEEDREPLHAWQQQCGLAIHIWHVFYDLAFGISLNEVERLVQEGYIQPTIQKYQAPGGASTEKKTYNTYYHYAYPLGQATEEPQLVAAHIRDKNGHILPFVRFEGGTLHLNETALDVLQQATTQRYP